MEKFLKYDISVSKELQSDHYGKVTVAPLEKGFGLTLGNALRRVLLSSITGSAAFAIIIKGASHEYQALEGIQEDVMQIILNIKNLVISIDENVFTDEDLANTSLEKWPTLKISKVSGQVRAESIECPAGFKIMNPELVLLNAAEKNKFEMEIYASRGRGFKTFMENRDRVNAIGLIAIDSNFSPVLQVAYSVEEIKTAKRGTSDKLVLEVSTNGSIDPASAVAIAARILSAHLEPLIEIKENLRQIEILKEKQEEERAALLAIPIEELDLTMRSYNGLKRANIQTVQELTGKTRDEIDKIRNLGKKSSREIASKLAERGLKFKEE